MATALSGHAVAVFLCRTPSRRRFKSLIRNFNLFEQPSGQLRIEMMPTAVTNHMTDHLAARQGQVADHIQYFVSNAFVRTFWPPSTAGFAVVVVAA